ncbi:hypothetical protein [Aeribacillus pallidus]|uniref:Uncharacterized protein n=1 Tax=Aeribacillus pallidus TaxID=33936 RepID=A0A161ZTT1_9BACI|nr:hypothetical protein [Aeribacillus pallidus]KZN96597.1 hypothetical protein AZI98_08080 [Aeribacillus pallidus]
MSANFKQRLLDLSKDFDEVFLTLQKSYSDEKLAPWYTVLLISPFKQASFWKIIKAINPLIFGVLTGLGISVFTKFSINTKIISCSIAIFIALVVMYALQFFRMVDIKNHENFHIGAYRLARKREYELFVKYIPFEFSFRGLYDEVVTHNPSRQELLIKEEQIKKQIEEHNKYVKQAKEEYSKLQKELEDVQEQTKLIVDLLKDIITIFYQFTNGYFTVYSLQFISGFTIYELGEDEGKKVLFKIADVGTTGHSSEKIMLPDKITDKDYAVIRALRPRTDRYEPEFDTPYKNRFIISFSMKMHNNITWVLNFHADEDNAKALFFLLTDSVMDTREVYRLIHSLCLNLQQKRRARKCGEKLH